MHEFNHDRLRDQNARWISDIRNNLRKVYPNVEVKFGGVQDDNTRLIKLSYNGIRKDVSVTGSDYNVISTLHTVLENMNQNEN